MLDSEYSAIPGFPGGLLHPALRNRLAEVEALDRAVIGTDPDGRVVHWNDGAELLYGWTADEALGHSIVELTPGDLAKPEAAEIMNALRAGQPWSGEFLVKAKDGSRFTAHVIDIPVTDDDGSLVGIVGISRRVAYLQERD